MLRQFQQKMITPYVGSRWRRAILGRSARSRYAASDHVVTRDPTPDPSLYGLWWKPKGVSRH